MKYVDLKLALSSKLVLAPTSGKTLRVVELLARLQKIIRPSGPRIKKIVYHIIKIDHIHL